MHPFKSKAISSNKGKAHSMGHQNNLDIPIMRAVGENRTGKPMESSASMQHMKQAASAGMKRGGRMAYPIDTGSGGGEARIEKARKGPFKPAPGS